MKGWEDGEDRRRRGRTGNFGVPRRRKEREEPAASEIELRTFFTNALTLNRSENTFDMDNGKTELAAQAWRAVDVLGAGGLTEVNPALASVLDVVLRNAYRPEPGEKREAAEHRAAFRIEGLLTNLARSQSQKQVTLLTARFSVAALRAHLPEMMWRAIALVAPGILCSKQWTEEFVECARDLRPPCPYQVLDGVAGTMFDNYTRRVQYASAVTVEMHGYLLHMTNWASMSIPKSLALPNFDATELCAL